MGAHLTKSFVENIEPRSKAYEIYDTKIAGFLVRVQPTGRLVFYFAYRNQARKNQRIKIGVYDVDAKMTVQKARDKASVYSGQVRSGVDVQGEKTQKRQNAIESHQRTLKVFIEDHYGPWALANLKTGQDTLDKLSSSFPDFMQLPLDNITVPLVERWRTKKLKDSIEASTINRCIAALRALLRKAVSWGVIDNHPLKEFKMLRLDKNPVVRFLSVEERRYLYKALLTRDKELKQARERGNQHRRERNYDELPSLLDCYYADRMTPIIILSLKTGLRRGEAFDLKWSDVDFVNMKITLRGDTTKSSHTRYIPISPIALKVLNRWKDQAEKLDGRVFPSDNGGRLNNLKKSWATIMDKAGIVNFRWHDMRHDFASQLVMKGVPLNTVRELCGHADSTTTQRYAHLAPGHIADAIALIG
ncbi:MAG: tyrosine-type recombinase/integrase [Cellvibrionaceae bacterium]